MLMQCIDVTPEMAHELIVRLRCVRQAVQGMHACRRGVGAAAAAAAAASLPRPHGCVLGVMIKQPCCQMHVDAVEMLAVRMEAKQAHQRQAAAIAMAVCYFALATSACSCLLAAGSGVLNLWLLHTRQTHSWPTSRHCRRQMGAWLQVCPGGLVYRALGLASSPACLLVWLPLRTPTHLPACLILHLLCFVG